MTRTLRICIATVLLGGALPATAQTPQATPPEAYRLDVLTPGSMYAFSPNQPAFLPGSLTWTATLDGERIGEAEFFRMVGRHDLARETTRRHDRAALLTAVGVITIVGGAVLVARGTPTVRRCDRPNSTGTGCDIFRPALVLPGAAMMVGGLVSVSFALPLTKRTVPARDAAAEARRFNADGR